MRYIPNEMSGCGSRCSSGFGRVPDREIGSQTRGTAGAAQNCVPALNVNMFWLKEAPAAVELCWT
jgi:hypothetical protein